MKMDIQEQIEDTASRVDVASVHSQQLEKKIKQFDKVWIEQDGDDGGGGGCGGGDGGGGGDENDGELWAREEDETVWQGQFTKDYEKNSSAENLVHLSEKFKLRSSPTGILSTKRGFSQEYCAIKICSSD